MKIALVSDFYLPSLGGAQTSIQNQKRALEAAGHEVFLFVASYNKPEPSDDDHTVRIPSLYIKALDFPVVLPNKKLLAQLGHYFDTFGINVVHSQTEFGLGRAATVVAKNKGIPSLYTLHTFSWETNYFMPNLQARVAQIIHSVLFGHKLPLIKKLPNESAMASTLKSFTFLMAQLNDCVICPSAHVARALRKAGATKPISVLPNPVALPADTQPKPLPKIPRLVWPSRLRPEKRIIEFITACLKAQELTQQQFYVDVVGDGPLLQAAKALAKGNKKIVFHGRLDGPACLDIVNKGSMVALSSYNFDNQPMVVAEAMRLGKGVLYCDSKLREGLDNAGYLTKKSPEAMAKGIADLVDHPQKIARLSKAAKHESHQFSPGYYAKEWMAIVNRLRRST